jgi:hypothetical protein
LVVRILVGTFHLHLTRFREGVRGERPVQPHCWRRAARSRREGRSESSGNKSKNSTAVEFYNEALLLGGESGVRHARLGRRPRSSSLLLPDRCNPS